ncbi:MAG: RluA family pseudouridine synthase [Thermoleophilia bacterium]|nr:RluA family pseudouridine synthase [Thermoleophilia bacterium]
MSPPPIRHVAGPDDAGRRVDQVIAGLEGIESRAEAQRLIDAGRVRVNGDVPRKRHAVADGDVIDVEPAAPAPTDLVPEDVPFRIAYEDAHLLVVDKPAGLVVHPSRGHETGTLVHGLLAHQVRGGDDPTRPGIVHRLDRDTSGVLVLARHRAAARTLTAAFRSKQTRKLYWAAVVGRPHPAQGRVDQPLAKRRGGSGQEKMAADGADGEPAVTLYRTIDHAQKAASWLALLPLTGRTHQLRAHCAALGTPILGDGKYGGAGAFLTGVDLPRRMHLHARRIVIPHPDPKRPPVDVTAELPAHMRTTWSLLGFADAEGDAGELF